MSDDACPIPTRPTDDEEMIIRRLLRAQRIAVVGLSNDPSRASFNVASYLVGEGKEIIPVNPNYTTILGRTCYPLLNEVSGLIDLVNVFRRPEHVADVAREAVAAGAKGLWLQSGVTSDEAAAIAREAKIDFIHNRCLMVEHMRHAER